MFYHIDKMLDHRKHNSTPNNGVTGKPDMPLGDSNIFVAVRSRPYTKKDYGVVMADIRDDTVVVLHDPEENSKRPEKAFRINRINEKHYAFDHAFG
jgi:hypothetical protein